MEIHDLDLQFIETKPKKTVFEPKSRYDYCLAFSKITKLPVGKFLKESKDWPMDWFYQIQSECKISKNQAACINAFFKKFRESLTDL